MSPEHIKLRMRLSPLIQVQEALLRKLTPYGIEYERANMADANLSPTREAWVNSSFQWKGKFGRMLGPNRDSFDSARDIDFDDPKDPGMILYNCRDDMIKLWNDPVIQELLNVTKQRFYDRSGL